MESIDTQSYSPILRLKSGERGAMPELVQGVRQRILPSFVAPPPSEHDAEMGRHLEGSELVAVTAQRLGRTWPLRPCLLDARFLFDELKRESAHIWLPDLFRLSRRYSAMPWLVASLSDIESFLQKAVLEVLRLKASPFALRLKPEDLEDDALPSRIHRVLISLARKPSDAILVLDFGNSIDFSDTSEAAEVMVVTLQRVLAIGLWSQVIWQATSFPEVNPSPAASSVVIARGEWLAFRKAWHLETAVKQNLMFGDYAADSAKFNFGSKAGIPAIPHFRYSTAEKWLVSRGAKDGKLSVEMPKVANRIVSSGFFAGPAFSLGDRYIFDVSQGRAIGQATNWRRANTVHHLTQVISNIGDLRDFEVERVPLQLGWQQMPLNI